MSDALVTLAAAKAGSTAAPRQAAVSVFRGDAKGGQMVEYTVPVETGMMVLDAIHWIQAHRAPDLAVRWNCKAAKCGSCAAEVNGRPSLLCATRLDRFAAGEIVAVRPMKTFPVIKDLVTDVRWNYEVDRRITPFTPQPGAAWKWHQHDVDRAQEFRKCIECFLCQNVCHVLRHHELAESFVGPRFFVRIAGLEMHPIDGADRVKFLEKNGGIGLCNLTNCCTEVCPAEIHITDDAIIPLEERVADRCYDPLRIVWRVMTGGSSI